MGRTQKDHSQRAEYSGKECYNKKAWQEKKGKEKAFIIGGGTSIKQILDVPDLYDSLHEYTLFGCNKAVEDFDCDYMVFHDLKFGTETHAHLVANFKGTGGVHAPHPSPGNANRKRNDVNYYKSSSTVSIDKNAGIYSGNNCGIFAMCLSIALGFKEIYLLGMDCRYSGSESHYHGGYGNDKSRHIYETFAHFFEVAGKWIVENRPDVKVYNCSFISLVDIERKYFKRINIRDVLNDRFKYNRKGKVDIQEDVCESS